ncbi:hypothetical protein JCM10213v2_001634 [Rhodosporidiobolus nylandii]
MQRGDLDYDGVHERAYLNSIGYHADLVPEWRADCASLLEVALAVLRGKAVVGDPSSSKRLCLGYAEQLWLYHLIWQCLWKGELRLTYASPPFSPQVWKEGAPPQLEWLAQRLFCKPSQPFSTGRSPRKTFDFRSLKDTEALELHRFLEEAVGGFANRLARRDTPVHVKPNLRDCPVVLCDTTTGQVVREVEEEGEPRFVREKKRADERVQADVPAGSGLPPRNQRFVPQSRREDESWESKLLKSHNMGVGF